MPLSSIVLGPTIAAAILSNSPAAALDTGSALPQPGRDARRTVEVSVLTYNVRGLPWPAARRRGAALKAIGRELAALRRAGRQPDIVLIQEGFLGEAGDLARISGYPYWAQGPGRAERPKGPPPGDRKGFRPNRYLPLGEGWGKFASAGLHILSDAPIEEVESAPFHYCAGFDCLANKGVMLARVALPGLPRGVDVVNTHLNSRAASKAPASRSLKAHNLQIDELIRFIADHRNAEAPLLVGGDFNVRNAPDRYDHNAAARPYKVVSEFCAGAPCQGQALGAEARPWLKSPDLQAFDSVGAVEVRPIRIETVFAAPASGGKLSDHDGYLVRYRLSWSPTAGAVIASN